MDADKKKKMKKLIWLGTSHVSLVDKGANRGGKDHFFMLKHDDGSLEKAVPSEDASPEDKRKAQMERSKKYGIEALEKDANLSYPSGDPTTESLYADPTNLKYPLGKTDNTKDDGRIRNAIARFKQAHTTYTQNSSKARVYERIVRAALAANIDVNYNPEDEIDQLLPGELKDRLSKQESDKSEKEEVVQKDEKPIEEKSDGQISDWHIQMKQRLDALSLNERLRNLEKTLSTKSEVAKSKPVESKVDNNEDKISELLKRSEDAESREAELRKENERIKAELGALKGTVTTSFAIRPGTKATESKKKNDDGGIYWEEDMGHKVEPPSVPGIKV